MPALLDDEPSAYADTTDATIVRVVLDRGGSALYAALCRPRSTGGACALASEVVLDENLDCYGTECELDTVRVVRIDVPADAALDAEGGGDETTSVWYEYARRECVELTFPERARQLRFRTGDDDAVCADEAAELAVGACCSEGGVKSTPGPCAYYGERVTYATAAARCAAEGTALCDFWWGKSLSGAGCHTDNKLRLWTSQPCTVLAQVSSHGFVAPVHRFNASAYISKPALHVRVSSGNEFFVHWTNSSDSGGGGGTFPTAATGCAAGACAIVDDTCLCNVSVASEAVFSGGLACRRAPSCLRSCASAVPSPRPGTRARTCSVRPTRARPRSPTSRSTSRPRRPSVPARPSGPSMRTPSSP